MTALNPVCALCDYVGACSKRLIQDNQEPVLIKEQTDLLPDCICKVQDICRTCELFSSRRCAAWKTLNGKTKSRGVMTSCPKKIPRGN